MIFSLELCVQGSELLLEGQPLGPKKSLTEHMSDGPLSEIDLEQLAKINEFKKKLGEIGTLHWSFGSTSEFERTLRIHLNKKAKKWFGLNESKISQRLHEEIHEDDGEEGLLDLIPVIEEYFTKATEVITRIGLATQDLTKGLHDRTLEIHDSHGSNDLSRYHLITSRVAQDMNEFADILNIQIPIFKETFGQGVDGISKVSNILNDFEALDREEFMKTVMEMDTGLKEGLEGVIEFRTQMNQLPRVTSVMNKAKGRTVGLLNTLIMEMESGHRVLTEALKNA